jgi:hypothetical protein
MLEAAIVRPGIIGAMRRRSRTRRILKWVGSVACGLTAALWVGTKWRHFQYCHRYGTVGTVTNFVWVSNVDYTPYYGKGFGMIKKNNAPPRWWPSVDQGTYVGGTRTWWQVRIPFWCVFLPVGIPTAFLWYRDRRPPKGHCRNCGYDLTGNVSGVCPECGQPTRGDAPGRGRFSNTQGS